MPNLILSGQGEEERSPEVQNFCFFLLHGQQRAPINGKFGMVKYTLGPLSHAKFGHNCWRERNKNPKVSKICKQRDILVVFNPGGAIIYADRGEVWSAAVSSISRGHFCTPDTAAHQILHWLVKGLLWEPPNLKISSNTVVSGQFITPNEQEYITIKMIKGKFSNKKSVPWVPSCMPNFVKGGGYRSPETSKSCQNRTFSAVFCPALATMYAEHGEFW